MASKVEYPQYTVEFTKPIAKLQIKIAKGMIKDLKRITPVSNDNNHLRDTWTYKQIIKGEKVMTRVWGGENYYMVHLIQNGTVKMPPKMDINPVIKKWIAIYIEEMNQLQPEINEDLKTIK